jgi:hypothetical protein
MARSTWKRLLLRKCLHHIVTRVGQATLGVFHVDRTGLHLDEKGIFPGGNFPVRALWDMVLQVHL